MQLLAPRQHLDELRDAPRPRLRLFGRLHPEQHRIAVRRVEGRKERRRRRVLRQRRRQTQLRRRVPRSGAVPASVHSRAPRIA